MLLHRATHQFPLLSHGRSDGRYEQCFSMRIHIVCLPRHENNVENAPRTKNATRIRNLPVVGASSFKNNHHAVPTFHPANHHACTTLHSTKSHAPIRTSTFVTHRNKTAPMQMQANKRKQDELLLVQLTQLAHQECTTHTLHI